MNLSANDIRTREPLFTLRETAAYLGLPESTVGAWASSRQDQQSLITRTGTGKSATVPFVGFAEAFVLSSFRRAGVPMQRIRPAVNALQEEIGLEHALASHRLYTDGAEVLFDYADKADDEGLVELVVVRSKQRQFSQVVLDYLKRIHYGSDGWATSVRLPAYGDTEVAVNPEVAFGQPIITSNGTRVEDLIDRFRAGDSISELSSDFDLPREALEDVIRVATQSPN